MMCFLNELRKLINKYDIKSIDITANIDKLDNFVLDTCTIIFKEDTKDNFIAHNPEPEELENFFRKECSHGDLGRCR